MVIYHSLRNASNTSSNTHFSTHSLWLVKVYMGPTKSCGSHINLMGPMWILTNQIECVEKCVLEGVLLAFLIIVLLGLDFFRYVWYTYTSIYLASLSLVLSPDFFVLLFFYINNSYDEVHLGHDVFSATHN